MNIQWCEDGRLYERCPQPDDPEFAVDVGACPGCEECDPEMRQPVDEEDVMLAPSPCDRGDFTDAEIDAAQERMERLFGKEFLESEGPIDEAIAQERARWKR